MGVVTDYMVTLIPIGGVYGSHWKQCHDPLWEKSNKNNNYFVVYSLVFFFGR